MRWGYDRLFKSYVAAHKRDVGDLVSHGWTEKEAERRVVEEERDVALLLDRGVRDIKIGEEASRDLLRRIMTTPLSTGVVEASRIQMKGFAPPEFNRFSRMFAMRHPPQD